MRKFRLLFVLVLIAGFFLFISTQSVALAASYGGGGPPCFGAKCDPCYHGNPPPGYAVPLYCRQPRPPVDHAPCKHHHHPITPPRPRPRPPCNCTPTPITIVIEQQCNGALRRITLAL